MNDLDDKTFERFARRFARIEHQVPDAPARHATTAVLPVRGRRTALTALAGLAILVSAAIMFAFAGSTTTPGPTLRAASVPPDSAPPSAVLEAYFVALVAGNCAIANDLTMPLVLNDDFMDLCAATHVTAFSIEGEPAVVTFESVRLMVRMTVTGNTTGLPAGELVGAYFLQRQTSGAWRIIQGYLSLPPPPTPPQPTATRPTQYELQQANPELGGTGWKITELAGVPQSEVAYLWFYGGPTGGAANGDSSADCFQIDFDYAYDVGGPAIAFFPGEEGRGSFQEGCSDAGFAQYRAIAAVLSRVAEWRKPAPNQLELLDAEGTIVLKGGPRPPLPMPSASGDCGSIPIDACQRAVALTFNYDLFPASGQAVVGWRVRDSIYTSCASPGDPKYDVIFELANPAGESTTTVVDTYGTLHPCGAY